MAHGSLSSIVVAIVVSIGGAARAQIVVPPQPPRGLLQEVQCAPAETCGKYSYTSRNVRVTFYETGSPSTVHFVETAVGYFDNFKVSFWLDAGNNPSAFDERYTFPETSIFAFAAAPLSIKVEVQGSNGSWTVLTDQRYHPIPQAVWSKHSEDTVELLESIDTEAASRIAGDGSLQSSLAAEAAARAAADGTLQSSLAAEVSARVSADAALQSSLAVEAAARVAADAALAGSLGNETARAVAAEGALSDALDGEIARAAAAELVLGKTVNGVAVDSLAGAQAGQVLAFTSSGHLAPTTISTTPPAPPPVTTATNPLQIATLRWWTDKRGLAFPINLVRANHAAFDGAYAWITDAGSGAVNRYRLSDGQPAGRFAVGGTDWEPQGIAFDGLNIWVAVVTPADDYGGVNDVLVRLNASNGALMDSIPIGEGIDEVVFDGRNVWVTLDRDVCRVDSLGPNATSCWTEGVTGGLAFDGNAIWVTQPINHTVRKISVADGLTIAQYPVCFAPNQLAFDGVNMWVTCGAGVAKLRASDGALLAFIGVQGDPDELTFDGTSLWVTSPDIDVVTRVRASDGAVTGTFSVGNGLGPAVPSDVIFDGLSVWVVNRFASTLFKL